MIRFFALLDAIAWLAWMSDDVIADVIFPLWRLG